MLEPLQMLLLILRNIQNKMNTKTFPLSVTALPSSLNPSHILSKKYRKQQVQATSLS